MCRSTAIALPVASDQLGRLIVVSGPTAAGKTTVGYRLASRLSRAVHIDGDAIQRFVVAGAVTMNVPPPPGALEQLELRHTAALAVSTLYRRAGFDVVISDNIFEDHVITLLRAALADGRVYFVMLDPTIEAIERRYNARPGGGYDESLTPEVLKQAMARTRRIGLWLDSSDQSAEETVTEILHSLERAAVTDV